MAVINIKPKDVVIPFDIVAMGLNPRWSVLSRASLMLKAASERLNNPKISDVDLSVEVENVHRAKSMLEQLKEEKQT